MAKRRADRRKTDLIGRRFGRLVVIGQSRPGHRANAAVRCRCDCGLEKDISRTALRLGRTRSCGCLRRELAAAREPPRICRVCACTERNCGGCIDRTGERCHWVEEDLCSACVGAEGPRQPAAEEGVTDG